MTRFIFRCSLSMAIIAIALSLIAAAPRQTSPNLTLSSLEVDLWPEYDRPSVLVIYHITLPTDIELPVDLALRIPSAVGDPNAVAVRDANGGLFTIAYDRTVNGEWSTISFTPTMPEIQIEYYDPSLVTQGSSKHFEYSWAGDYAVNSLTVQVQQPVGASDMHITPGMGGGVTRPDGLTYYGSEAGSLPAGQEFKVTVDYTKSSDALSAESLQIQPSAPVSTITPTGRNLLALLPWILGGLGVVLIVGGGGWWYWQSGIGKIKAPKAPRRKRKLVITAEPDEVPEGYVYCHHCGKRATTGDRFCRTCGTRLRA
jgi:hypothetical protein